MADDSASPRSREVTLQTIADRAGVTRALVSMALRNSPKVSEKSRKKIQQLAKELGYRPNPMVSSLMSSLRRHRKTSYQGTLAFLTNLKSADYWRTLHTYPEYFFGASGRGHELGYEMEHFWIGAYKSNPNGLLKMLRARGVPGLIIAPLPQGSGGTLPFDFSSFSAVTFGYSLERPPLPRICNHHVQTVEEAVDRLNERGYRRIGVALSAADIAQVNHLWMAGFTVAQRKFPKIEFLFFNPAAWSQAAYRRWVVRYRPEVIVGVTFEIWDWTRQLDLAIPEELGFLHLDCRADDTLSGMCQNTRRLGEVAVEMLAGLVEGNIRAGEEEPRVVMLRSQFHQGTTLRA